MAMLKDYEEWESWAQLKSPDMAAFKTLAENVGNQEQGFFLYFKATCSARKFGPKLKVLFKNMVGYTYWKDKSCQVMGGLKIEVSLKMEGS